MEIRNKNVELVFIIDISGSMAGMESDTIGGFNSMLEQQKKTEGNKFVTTYLFNQSHRLLHDRLDIGEGSPLTERDYCARGSTALIDCIGDAIKHIEYVHRYIRPEDVPVKTIFAITTDGLENASRKYSSSEVKAMIERKKKEDGWEFLFIGANIDAISTAKSFGIEEDRAVNYRADKQGTGVVYQAVCKAVSGMRKGGKLAPGWSAPIQEDFENNDRG